jgi:acyl carrier protein
MRSPGHMPQQIRRFILTSFLFSDDESKLKNNDSLLEQGIMDSTGVLELVAFLESQFGIKVADEELVPDNLDSVDRIVAFVGSKQPAQSRAAAAV